MKITIDVEDGDSSFAMKAMAQELTMKLEKLRFHVMDVRTEHDNRGMLQKLTVVMKKTDAMGRKG